MKSGWQKNRLGEVSDIVMGQSPDGSSYNTTGDGVPLINGPVEFSEESFGPTVRSKFTTEPTKFCKKGDLILCVRGSTTGRMNIAGFDACIGRGVASIRAHQFQPWINHFIASQREVIHGKGTGATFPNVSGETLASLELLMPPLPEQKRIVGILDEAFAGIAIAKANAEKNLHNARAIFESHLESVFTQRGPGWEVKTLERCCEQIFAGGDVPKDRFSLERTEKYTIPIYSNGEKRDGLYGFTDVARVIKPSITVSARGTLGFTLIRIEPFFPVIRLIVLVPDERLLTLSFLYYSVIGMDFGNTGTSIPQLTVPNFKESKVCVPALLVQRAIAAKLDSLRQDTQSLERVYERKLAALDALKNSLLDEAFTGQL